MMACTHERIKSVNCVLFCDICGAELPAGWFTDNPEPKAPEAAESAKEPQETKPKKAPTATKAKTTKKGGK